MKDRERERKRDGEKETKRRREEEDRILTFLLKGTKRKRVGSLTPFHISLRSRKHICSFCFDELIKAPICTYPLRACTYALITAIAPISTVLQAIKETAAHWDINPASHPASVAIKYRSFSGARNTNNDEMSSGIEYYQHAVLTTSTSVATTATISPKPHPRPRLIWSHLI